MRHHCYPEEQAMDMIARIAGVSMTDDSCAENCKYFDFAPKGKSDPGYGGNWWCKLHAKRIKVISRKCRQWEDRYKQRRIEDEN
jgi:hypothetical protein